MKNTKILLPAVLVIWGLLFYQIYNYLQPEEIDIPVTANTEYVAPKITQKEHFSLKPLDRDPFLGVPYTKKKNTSSKVKKTVLKSGVSWPNIQFLGIVEDKKSNSKIYILNINGEEELIAKDQDVRGITLISGSSEKVRLSFETEVKEFSLL